MTDKNCSAYDQDLYFNNAHVIKNIIVINHLPMQ